MYWLGWALLCGMSNCVHIDSVHHTVSDEQLVATSTQVVAQAADAVMHLTLISALPDGYLPHRHTHCVFLSNLLAVMRQCGDAVMR